MIGRPSRRTVLLGLLASGGLGQAEAQQVASFASVAVDLSAIEATGGGATAAAFRGPLLAEMRAIFADRLVPGRGPVLVAKIASVGFASYAGDDMGFFGNNDTIEGDGVVMSGRTVLSSTHILTELPPSYSGAYYTPGIDERRMVSLAHQFAWWLRREMGI